MPNVTRAGYRLTSADGRVLNFLNKNIDTFKRIAGIHTNDYLKFSVSDQVDPLYPDLDGYGRLKYFLEGDLSTITFEFDQTHIDGDTPGLVETKSRIYTGYTTDIVICAHTRYADLKHNEYSVIIKKTNSKYEEAIQTKEDIMDLYNAIAEMYESKLISEEAAV